MMLKLPCRHAIVAVTFAMALILLICRTAHGQLGTGTVNGTVTGGTVGGVGTLTLASSLTLAGSSVYQVDISGATSDKLSITGNLLDYSGAIDVVGTPTIGDTYVIATYASDAGSTFIVATSKPFASAGPVTSPGTI